MMQILFSKIVSDHTVGSLLVEIKDCSDSIGSQKIVIEYFIFFVFDRKG